MRIGILTYYGVHNHGALLQAYALQRTLSRAGHQVEFLTFERDYSNLKSVSEKKYGLSLAGLPAYFSFFRERGMSSTLFNVRKRLILDKFRRNYLTINHKYQEFDGDCVIIGSDEVFSLEIGFNPALFGLGINQCKVLSYAGSFGPSVLQDVKHSKHRDDIIRGLESFVSIGTRDQNTSEIVEELTGRTATIVCDPVLLDGYTYEKSMASCVNKRYLLVYAYDMRMNTADEVKQIKGFAREHGLEIVSVGYYHKWCDRNIICSPLSVPSLFANAAYVVTDTFHGCVLSIIGEAPFVAIIRNNSNKLVYLLNQCGLNKRSTWLYTEIVDILKEEIEFKPVREAVDKLREESMLFLKKSLEMIQ